jgi:hypothetical protein
MTYAPDTPPQAEAALQALSDQMDIARQGLREARNLEVEAEHAYRAAWRAALFSDECPKVGVFGGIRVTVAERDAWVAGEVAERELEWQIAKATRKAAADHLGTLKAQASVGQSINGSLREQYRGTGRYGT